MSLKTGEIVRARYHVAALLAQGGMGAIYGALDTRLGVPVAVKEMRPPAGAAPETLPQLHEQFRQEAQVLARLNHPHLVRVTDFFSWRGADYLVMNFIKGTNLAECIDRFGAMPERQVLIWARQLLDALDYCHNSGVIHRDIKPQNVIVRPSGEAVLVDFGLVKLWNSRDQRTKPALRGIGTVEYAPPEQFDPVLGHTDPRSDIYSLGATLYHALTGQAPLTATMRVAEPQEFVPLRAALPDVSPTTERVILKALELTRSQRWSSARQMAAALDGVRAAARGIPIKKLSVQKARCSKTRVLPPLADAEAVQEGVASNATGTGAEATPLPDTVRQFVRRVPVWGWTLAGTVTLTLITVATLLWGGHSSAAPAPTSESEPSATVITTATPAPTSRPTVTLRVLSSPTPLSTATLDRHATRSVATVVATTEIASAPTRTPTPTHTPMSTRAPKAPSTLTSGTLYAFESVSILDCILTNDSDVSH